MYIVLANGTTNSSAACYNPHPDYLQPIYNLHTDHLEWSAEPLDGKVRESILLAGITKKITLDL